MNTKKTINITIVAITAFLFLTNYPSAQAAENLMLHAANGAVVDSTGSPVSLRCVSLSPWLDPEPYLTTKAFKSLITSPSQFKQRLAALVGPDQAQDFWQQWMDSFVTENDFKHLAQTGFNCVRLPLNYKYFVDSVDNGVVQFNQSGIQPVDNAVTWGQKYGIYVMIDLHVAPGGQNVLSTVADVPSNDTTARLWEGPTASQNKSLTVAICHALAARYAQATSVGGYDLINEPALPKTVSKDALPTLYSAIIAAIRSVDPAHMIILEGDNYAHDFLTLVPPPDANVMYEFHEYAIGNRDWKTPNQQALNTFIQLRASSHMPLWLGEFGENTAIWQGQMVQLMKANNIGWAVWPWKRISDGNPVIQTIVMPDSWNKLSKYLVGAILSGKPAPAQAQEGMSQMLQAIRTQSCQKDSSVEEMLAGK